MENSKYQALTDEEIIRLYQAEQLPVHIEVILKRNYHLIYGACYKVLQGEEDAKDVCLEICALLCEKLKTEKVENFSSWLYSVCHNRSVSFIRKKATRRKYEVPPTISEKTGENVVENQMLERLSPEEPATNNLADAKENLSGLMSKLPDAQRICLQLFYFKKMSYAQIAVKTKSDVKQVKSHLQSGKRKLRLLYEDKQQSITD